MHVWIYFYCKNRRSSPRKQNYFGSIGWWFRPRIMKRTRECPRLLNGETPNGANNCIGGVYRPYYAHRQVSATRLVRSWTPSGKQVSKEANKYSRAGESRYRREFASRWSLATVRGRPADESVWSIRRANKKSHDYIHCARAYTGFVRKLLYVVRTNTSVSEVRTVPTSVLTFHSPSNCSFSAIKLVKVDCNESPDSRSVIAIVASVYTVRVRTVRKCTHAAVASRTAIKNRLVRTVHGMGERERDRDHTPYTLIHTVIRAREDRTSWIPPVQRSRDRSNRSSTFVRYFRDIMVR